MKRSFASPRRRLWKCLPLAAFFFNGTALAQLRGDGVPRSRTVSELEMIKEEMSKARFHLGPLRIIPVFQLSEAGYDNNVYGSAEGEDVVADWTATVSAGALYLLPVTSRVFLRGEALPEYTWYQEATDRRTFGGFYGNSLLGFFNRLSFETRGAVAQRFETYSSELPARILQQKLEGFGRLEFDLRRSLTLYGEGQVLRIQYKLTGGEPREVARVRRNDRTDAVVQAGLRLKVSPTLSLSASVEGNRTEFLRAFQDQNNQGTAYLAGLHFSRPKVYFNVIGGYREAQPYEGSLFPKVRTGSGSYFFSYFPARRLELQLYGGRRLVYSLVEENPYYIETRNGGGVNLRVFSRVLLRGFGEFGPDEYDFPILVGDRTIKRQDDVTIVGGSLSVNLFRNVALTGLVSRTVYTSNLPGVDRSILRFSAGLNLQGGLTR